MCHKAFGEKSAHFPPNEGLYFCNFFVLVYLIHTMFNLRVGKQLLVYSLISVITLFN